MMPHSLLVYEGNSCSKVKCQNCKKLFRSRNVVFMYGIPVCANCRIKQTKVYEIIKEPKIKLEQALNKTYLGNVSIVKNRLSVNLHLPSCLAGKKFKLILI